MLNDDDRHGEFRGEARNNLRQGLRPAGGDSNREHIDPVNAELPFARGNRRRGEYAVAAPE